MKFGFSESCLKHDTGERHPETADRLRVIRQSLSRRHGVEYVEPDPAPIEAIEAVHDAAYVEAVREFCEEGGGRWDPDTVAVEESWEAALASAGLATWALRDALEGYDGRQTPFALGRPPGHHAVVDDAMGFCFFNNAAVAAQRVLETSGAERIAIVDWDVHHGNGTQDIFWDRGDVFYASVHEDGLYPGTGAADEYGEGDGEGTTCNVPLDAGAGDASFTAAFGRLFDPLITDFDPDAILVSAGFDAHRSDPISRLRVSTEGFGYLAHLIRTIADETGAGLAFVLEGGYGLEILGESVATVHEVFDGYDPEAPNGALDEDTDALIETLRDIHGIA